MNCKKFDLLEEQNQEKKQKETFLKQIGEIRFGKSNVDAAIFPTILSCPGTSDDVEI